MTCTYRGHGAVLAMGAPLDRAIGRDPGQGGRASAPGKGGSMHLTDVSVRRAGSFAVVGAHLPFACGTGVRRADARHRVGVAVLLRRRRHQHRRLPRGAEPGRRSGSCRWCSCARTTSTASTRRSLARRRSTGWPTGRQPTRCPACRSTETTSMAVRARRRRGGDRARAGDGPTLIEALTYRHMGHSRSDPGRLPAGGRARAVEAARPDHAPRAGAGRPRRGLAGRVSTRSATAAPSRRCAEAHGRALAWPDPSRTTDSTTCGRCGHERASRIREAVIRALGDELEADDRG